MPPSPVHRKSAPRLSAKNATATRAYANKLRRWSSLTSDRVILSSRRPLQSLLNFYLRRRQEIWSVNRLVTIGLSLYSASAEWARFILRETRDSGAKSRSSFSQSV